MKHNNYKHKQVWTLVDITQPVITECKMGEEGGGALQKRSNFAYFIDWHRLNTSTSIKCSRVFTSLSIFVNLVDNFLKDDLIFYFLRFPPFLSV